MSSLHFYYSTMNAGKTTNLLKDNYNYLERGMNTFVLKPSIDTREAEAVVRSRMGQETPCKLFADYENLYALVSKMVDDQGKPACIFIDEAQFMTKRQVHELTDIVDKLDIPVMCYGLRSDFQGKLFPGSEALFALSNNLTEIRTICWCGKRANMVLRLDGNGVVVRVGNQVQVGGNDSYVSVCRWHFKTGQIKAA